MSVDENVDSVDGLRQSEELVKMQQERQEMEVQLEELRLENELLKQQNQEIGQQNHQLQQQVSNVVLPVVPDYEAVRDRILKNWRIAKAPEKKERIKEALDRFVAELDSTPPSTSIAPVLEWVRYALEDLDQGEIGNAKRSLKQAIAVVEPPKLKPQEPSIGTAAPLVDEVVKKLSTIAWYTKEHLFDDLRPIAQQ